MKKNNAEYLLVFTTIAMLGLGLFGCDTLSPEPVGLATVEQIYKGPDGAITAINAAYAPLASNGGYNLAIPWMAMVSSDNAFTKHGFHHNLLLVEARDRYPEILWDAHFRGIARSNVVLARVPGIEFPSDQAALKESILGQALFLRAMYYFNLVRFFGDVPLITRELESPQEAAVPRAPTKEVYAQIEKDLIAAAKKLPKKSELDGSRGWEEGRATKGAAKALLAKVYLTLERWADAARVAKEVIDSGEYALFSDYAANFQGRNENGIESVFEIQYSDASNATSARHNTAYGPVDIVGGGGSHMRVIPTNDSLVRLSRAGITGNGIVQAFEPGDLRKDVALSNYGLSSYYFPEAGGPMVPVINKYFVGEDIDRGTSVNVPVLRYAEVLLIRAEALNEMGRGTEAAALVNQVRARAGLAPLPSEVIADQGALREAIWHERRVELCFEFKRFWSLNRTGRLKEALAVQGIEVDPAKISSHPITDKPQYLFPIPLSAMLNNANMTQNPGY